MKKLLAKEIGQSILSISEFKNLSCKVEALLNSRLLSLQISGNLFQQATPFHDHTKTWIT
jgi:hypothetical protein